MGFEKLIHVATIAVKAAPTPLPSNTVLRTNSESKPRCPEQTEAYNFNKPNHQAENQDVRTLANAINRIQT